LLACSCCLVLWKCRRKHKEIKMDKGNNKIFERRGKGRVGSDRPD
jgi:hypothetical protein